MKAVEYIQPDSCENLLKVPEAYLELQQIYTKEISFHLRRALYTETSSVSGKDFIILDKPDHFVLSDGQVETNYHSLENEFQVLAKAVCLAHKESPNTGFISLKTQLILSLETIEKAIIQDTIQTINTNPLTPIPTELRAEIMRTKTSENLKEFIEKSLLEQTKFYSSNPNLTKYSDLLRFIVSQFAYRLIPEMYTNLKNKLYQSAVENLKNQPTPLFA